MELVNSFLFSSWTERGVGVDDDDGDDGVCVSLFVLFLQQYELHEEKVDPAHARRHHMEAQAAEAAALGLGGYALYEHHQAHKIHKAEEQIPGHHHQKHGHRHHNRRHQDGF